MESTIATPQQLVAHIDQKAVRLSAVLRDIDNHPVTLEQGLQEQLERILEQLECRIAATRSLLRQRTSDSESSSQ